MAILKCKMCGGDLEITGGVSVCKCEYCGTKQTVPSADNEKKMNLFSRANRLRFACEFDKAAGVYESIVADFSEEAEAYWGLVLCKYGIEYVDDPATGKKVPTCHRSSFESVMDDENFDQALENADPIARSVYREEAKQIEELRRGIIEVSGKEEPYDIFICYKETAENGERTIDSVIAQDVYDELTAKGYRVFFSRITLEDKLGQEYEPYIFAALNSAKIMLAFGTDYEYYNAVWVKNEWSRFLQLIAKGEKKTLIPCYKNIDAYDMPKEFTRLQAQDMSKVGAVQDLLRGIEKIIGKENTLPTSVPVATPQNALTERGMLFLEDREWKKANEYFERALDQNPRDGQAYLGKVLSMLQIESLDKIDNLVINIQSLKDFARAIQYATPDKKEMLQEVYDRAHRKWLVKCICYTLQKAVKKKEREEYIAEQKRIEEERIAEQKRIEQKRIKELPIKRKKLEKAVGIISMGAQYAVGLKSDGTVVTTGSVGASGWRDIVAVAAGHQIFGLKSDGTVVTTGYGRVSGWRDIVAVAAGIFHTVGLKSNGNVVATGDNEHGECDVSGWRDIVAISAADRHTVGLKPDGTVVATGYNAYGQCDVSGWRDIVAIAAGGNTTFGLKSDGTVVATSDNVHGQFDMFGWRDIVTISASFCRIVGLKSDGTVVATGYNVDGQCDVSGWRDIVAISASFDHTVGLKSDGTVVAVGKNDKGLSNVSNWKLFENIDTLEEEREQQKRKEEARIAKQKRLEKEERRNIGVCQHCGGSFKGLFTKKCSKCGMKKDY